MLSKQLVIPGMLPPAPPKPKKLRVNSQLGQLLNRVLLLELEVSLLRIQLGDYY